MFCKVITKLLAARLSEILPSLIDKTQSAFVKGRSIVENIHLAQEIIRGYIRKEQPLSVHLNLTSAKPMTQSHGSF